MEIVGGILAGLIVLAILALVGVTALAGFALMGVLGLLTDMSFRRVFFTSFGFALIVPLILGIGGFAALEDGSLERELRSEMGGDMPTIEIDPGELGELIPRIRDLREDLREGRIEPEEFERQVEQLIDESTGVQIDVDSRDVSEVDGPLQIEVD